MHALWHTHKGQKAWHLIKMSTTGKQRLDEVLVQMGKPTLKLIIGHPVEQHVSHVWKTSKWETQWALKQWHCKAAQHYQTSKKMEPKMSPWVCLQWLLCCTQFLLVQWICVDMLLLEHVKLQCWIWLGLVKCFIFYLCSAKSRMVTRERRDSHFTWGVQTLIGLIQGPSKYFTIY